MSHEELQHESKLSEPDVTDLRVLLIEDSDDDREIVALSLRQASSAGPTIRLDTAANLADALAALGKNRYDAVVTDLQLPDSSGSDTFKQVYAAATAPVIVLTVTETLPTALDCIGNGASDYVIKNELHRVTLYRSILFSILRTEANLPEFLQESVRTRLESIALMV